MSKATLDSLDEHVKASPADGVKQIKSVRNACAVLEAIAGRQPVGVSELARVTGIDKSAVQRLIVTLHAAGWLHLHPVPPTRWRLSPANPVLRHAAMHDLASLVQPAMERLRDQSGETVIFVTGTGGRFFVAAAAESRQTVRVSVPVGFALAVDSSSAAAAIVAHLPEAERRPIQQAHPSLDDGLLNQIRRRGWADTLEEAGQGTRAAAAALVAGDGYPVGALAVCGPANRISPDDLSRLGALVAETAGHVLTNQPSQDPGN